MKKHIVYPALKKKCPYIYQDSSSQDEAALIILPGQGTGQRMLMLPSTQGLSATPWRLECIHNPHTALPPVTNPLDRLPDAEPDPLIPDPVVEEISISFKLFEPKAVKEWLRLKANFAHLTEMIFIHLLQIHADHCHGSCALPQTVENFKSDKEDGASLCFCDFFASEEIVDSCLTEVEEVDGDETDHYDDAMEGVNMHSLPSSSNNQIHENFSDVLSNDDIRVNEEPCDEAEIVEDLLTCITFNESSDHMKVESDHSDDNLFPNYIKNIRAEEEKDPEYIPGRQDSEDELEEDISTNPRRRRARRIVLPPQYREDGYAASKQCSCPFCPVMKINMSSVVNHVFADHSTRGSLVPIRKTLASIKMRSVRTKDKFLRTFLKKCNLCGKNFVFYKMFIEHECTGRSVKLPVMNTYRCTSCTYCFVTKSQLHFHEMRAHRPNWEKRQNYQQKLCAHKLWRVEREAYKKLLPWLLRVKSSFPDRSTRRRLKAHHNSLMGRMCRVCFVVLTSPSIIRRHLLSVHGIHVKKLKHVCYTCNCSLSTKAALNKHMQVHLQRFLCDYCGKTFSKEYNRRSHVELYHENAEYSCQLCARDFRSKVQLLRHHSSVHLIGPHPCSWEGCGKSFTREYNLRVHMRSHTGEKPYVCEKCAYSCANRNSLNHHMLQTHGINIRTPRLH